MFRSARHEVGNDTDAEARDHDVIVERRVVRPWAIVALVVGIAAIAFGVWGLVRTGLNSDHIFTPTKDVLGVHQTPALALGEIAFGLLLLIAASMPAVGRVLMALLGAASLAFGVVVLADGWSHRIDRWTAANDTTGWMFVVVGAVIFLSALLPTMRSEREVAAEQPVTAAESGADATDAERRADRTPASHERGRHWWQPVHGHRAGA
jgi:uncharacterized membrane protein